MVANTYKELKDKPADRYYKRLRTFGSGYLEVLVSPANLKRAMLIMDAFIKEMKRLSFEVGTNSSGKYSKSYLLIGNEKVYFFIKEEGKRHKKETTTSNRWGDEPQAGLSSETLRRVVCITGKITPYWRWLPITWTGKQQPS
ncbi:MAG: hypothetical protein WD491_00225, partial [Balneolales bacterium]